MTALLFALALPAADRPDVVLIVADDMGYGDLGCYGCADIPTPHLDRLAGQGVRFTGGYSSHPFCSPMRAGLMTGRYQHRFGYETNIAYDPHNARMGLPTSQTTVAERMKDAGYRTGLVGKWHLGSHPKFLPNQRGFDTFLGFPGGGHDYFAVDLNRPPGEGYGQPLHRNGSAANVEGYLTDQLTAAAVEFLSAAGDRPRFLMVMYNAPHTPMQAPPALIAKFASIQNRKRRTYAAMVSALDTGVGRILEAIDRGGRADSTLVCFVSDNGGPEKSNGSDNGPLRGAKGDVLEGGVRVPFIARWPGRLEPGECHTPVNTLDLTATALAAAGIENPTPIEGIDLRQSVSGAGARPLFWRKEGGAAWAVRDGPLKLVGDADGPQSLYDLDADVGETTDLAADRTAEVARLQGLYNAWNADNIAPFFPGFRGYIPARNTFHKDIVPDVP